MKKQAILLAHFGTSHADTREKTIGAVERDVRAAFPDWEKALQLSLQKKCFPIQLCEKRLI